MREVRLLLHGLLAVVISYAQSNLVPQAPLLEKIRLRMAESLDRLPNYTCLQTIERSYRRAPSHKFEMQDIVRLEVGLVQGKELFAWPGSGKFDERDVTEMVKGGAIGNGNFALHARAIFLARSAEIHYAGEEELNQRRVYRFDYQVPLQRSTYRLRVLPNQALVAYHGSFWADAANLDVLRLEVDADQIPRELEIQAARKIIEYSRMPIGSVDFLLPAHSEMGLVDLRGNENRNHTILSACRQFAGESQLSFADAPTSAAPDAPPIEQRDLPPGLILGVRLETGIDSSSAASGDQIFAVLEHDVKSKGQLLAPKGAKVQGRLLRLERGTNRNFDFYTIGLEFSILEFGNVRARTAAVVGNIAGGLSNSFLAPGRMVDRPVSWGHVVVQQAEAGVFYLKGSRVQMPRGLRLSLRTGMLPNEEK
ncbi:MAG: hypothetical protein NTY38_14330 [Acidobacteria bacterium]|nr:hypothetical protein [Acidobacteriota bacterium]